MESISGVVGFGCAAAQGVGEHLLRECAAELIALVEKDFFQLRRAVESAAVGKRAGGVDARRFGRFGGCGLSLMLCSRRLPDRILDRARRRWRRSFPGRSRADPFARGTWRRRRCCDAVPFAGGPWRSACRRGAAASSGTSGGGGGGGVPRMFSRIHLPRLTGEVRSGLEVTVSTAASVITPPRGLSAGRSTRRNSSPSTPSMP